MERKCGIECGVKRGVERGIERGVESALGRIQGVRLGRWSAAILAAAFSAAMASNQYPTAGLFAGTMGAGAATAAEPLALGQNPAALGLISSDFGMRAGFHLDYHHPYGIQELTVSEAGAFFDFNAVGAGISWRETEIDGVYREMALAVNPAFRIGRSWVHFPGRLELGLAWNGYRTELAGEPVAVNFTQDLGLLWRPLPRLKLGVFAGGLAAPWQGVNGSDRLWQIGMEASNRAPTLGGAGLQTLKLDFRKNGQTPLRTLAALTLYPCEFLRISAGFASPPFQISFGLNIAWKGFSWYQSHRYHRFLGGTSLAGIAVFHDFDPGDG